MDDRERRKSLVDRANDAYSAYRSARGLYQLGRGAMAAARSAQAAVAGIGTLGAAGWPIVIAILLIVVPTFLIVMGGQGDAATGTTEAQKIAESQSSETTLSPVFYCQYDRQWTDSTCNIAQFGCVPTAIAMILSSFGDHEWSPRSVSSANGNMGCGDATDLTEIRNSLSWIKSLGYEVADENLAFETDFKIAEAKQYIEDGYLLLGVANVSFISGRGGGGHSFVITGVDSQSQELTVLDPTYCTSDDDFARRFLSANEVLCNAEGCGWYYVKAIKKI